MTTEKLLNELGARNIRLRRNRDELILIGDRAVLEPSLIGQVRAHKASLLALIDSEPSELLSPGIAITPDMVTLLQLTQQEIDTVVQQVPGRAANVQDMYPLAPLQEGILFHHRTASEGDPYLLGVLMRFASRERMDKYIEAVQWVVGRHDILRTAIVWEGLPEPVQVVWRKAQLAVEEVALEGDTAEELYQRFHPRRMRIDVRQAPMLRLFIAHDIKNDCWLMMRLVHHLIGDHYSMDLMQEEIAAYLLGREAELPPPAPFRNMLAQARLGVSKEEHDYFFRQMLGDVQEPTAPFGFMQVLGDGTGIEEATLDLDQRLTTRIRERARQLRVSPAILFHLAWACVVSRASGRDEAVFGTVLFGQLRRGVSDARVMGVFINTLPLRITVAGEGVQAAVVNTQKLLADLTRHEHASLVLAQKCSAVPAPQPLFTSILNYRHIKAGVGTELSHAWDGISYVRGEERSNYPIGLAVNDFGESASVTAQTVVAMDPMRLCEFMRTALESLVEALETTPAAMVQTVDVMPAVEREQVLYGWNATAREYPGTRCVHELFAEQVARAPEQVAVVYEDQQLTYGDLNRRSNRLAHYLRKLGVGPDVRVGICLDRSLQMIEAVLGVLKAGGAYVPLDPAHPEQRLAWMLENAEAPVLVTRASVRGRLPAQSALVVDVETEAERIAREPASNPQVELTGANLAYVIYTSGSTGQPKGVMVTHGGARNLAAVQAEAFAIEAGSRVLQFASLSFDAATWEWLMALTSGAALVLAGPEEAFGGAALKRLLERERVEVATIPPSVLETVPGDRRDLPALRTLVVAGEACAGRLVERWSEGQRMLNAYGPTEVTVCATISEALRGTSDPGIGRPIGNAQVYVLDEQMRPSPIGVAGELYIGGAGLARGYLNRGDLTAERFLPDPIARRAGARLYRTGDRVRWRKSEELEYLGRRDGQVKIRGFRIETGEIETAVREDSTVRQCAVVAREESGEQRLVGYVVWQQETTGALEALKERLKQRLPAHMLPGAWVQLNELPLTTNGKLDRRGLPAPDARAGGAGEWEAPVGEVEETLAEIWSQLLGVEPIGRNDNFFELGGHSLLALQVIEKTQRRLQREAAVKDLLAHPQLESFATFLETPRHQNAERAVPIRERGSEPALFFPHGADNQTTYGWTIAPNIDADFPIYELPAQPQNATPRLRTIEGQAQRMVKMIRAVQPAGPYRIIGYCFGSFLAYEIARQLLGADEEVFLALLNFRLISGQTDRLPLAIPAAVNQDLKIKFLTGVREHVAVSNMPESVQEAVAALGQSSKTLEDICYYCKDMGWLPEPWMPVPPVGLQRMLVHQVDMERAPYLFSLLPIDIHMFVAQDAKSAATLPGDFAALVPGAKLRCFPAAGNHETMVQNPNVKQLGRSLLHAIEDASKNKTKAPEVRCLVRLTHRLSPTQDRGAPLFCVPESPMRAHCFADIVSSLTGSRPVYAFQARGLYEDAIPHTTIEAKARFHLNQLETVSAAGPIHLLGHSRGGWVAMEMALMLQAAGREVLSVTLLDTPPPGENSADLREYTVTEVVGNLLEFVELSAGRLSITLLELEREDPATQRQILLELLVNCGALPAGAANIDLYRVLQILGAELRTSYIPRRAFRGTIHLIRAAASKSPESQNNQKIGAGWGRWASHVIESCSSGNRMTMLRALQGKKLAESLDQEMNRADR
jgi:amino acid adenylation domain-containing protein